MKKLHSFDEVFDGQKVFRTILEGMSNPGRILSISEQAEKLYGDDAAFLALAITLLDNEVSFFACENAGLSENIPLLTLSSETDMENADYIFVNDSEMLEEIFEKAKIGSLADPQQSATIFIKTELGGDNELKLYGSGIDKEISLFVSDVVYRAVNLRDKQRYEYPQGVDMVFVSKESNILCIPRLCLQKGEK